MGHGNGNPAGGDYHGLRLGKLADIPAQAGSHRPEACLPDGAWFPRFMVLAFRRP